MICVFRYSQTRVYQYLLTRAELQVNLKNCHGQTALHIAARWVYHLSQISSSQVLLSDIPDSMFPRRLFPCWPERILMSTAGAVSAPAPPWWRPSTPALRLYRSVLELSSEGCQLVLTVRYFQALLEDSRVDLASPGSSLRVLRDQVGAALVSLELSARASVLQVLAGRERSEKAAAVSEFSLDEGYLTTSSTGSEIPARARYILP